jgi:hypothetical protein
LSHPIPADIAIRELEASREERLSRPSPYVPVEGNPFGSGHHDCPIDGCDVWRVKRYALESHLLIEHSVVTARDVERVNCRTETEAQKTERRARARAHMKEVVARARFGRNLEESA